MVFIDSNMKKGRGKPRKIVSAKDQHKSDQLTGRKQYLMMLMMLQVDEPSPLL